MRSNNIENERAKSILGKMRRENQSKNQSHENENAIIDLDFSWLFSLCTDKRLSCHWALFRCFGNGGVVCLSPLFIPLYATLPMLVQVLHETSQLLYTSGGSTGYSSCKPEQENQSLTIMRRRKSPKNELIFRWLSPSHYVTAFLDQMMNSMMIESNQSQSRSCSREMISCLPKRLFSDGSLIHHPRPSPCLLIDTSEYSSSSVR